MALIWSLAHSLCGASGEPIANPAWMAGVRKDATLYSYNQNSTFTHIFSLNKEEYALFVSSHMVVPVL